jgi:FHA domain
MTAYQKSTPCFVGLQPDSLRGSTFEIKTEHVLVGRDGGCDVVLDDPRVSRRHAALERAGVGVVVHDLGSRGGTWVNDQRVTAPRPLHDGDVVAFAGVSLRFQEHAGGPETLMWQPPPPAAPRFDVERQHGGVISNVGRDQHHYNSYVQHVMHERQSFLRDIAATRSKAWLLVCFGFLLGVVGFAVWAANIFNFIDNVQNIGPDTQPDDLPLLGRKLLGIPVAVYGFGGVVLGAVLLVIGIVLHVVAAARKRRLPAIPPPPRY